MKQNFDSGEWNGFYIEQNRGRGWMHLFLTFENGVIKGEGTDYVGPWVAVGEFNNANGQCSWVKQYLGKHKVHYQGVLGENGIEGQWNISISSGPFHIWPRSMTHLNELYLRDELPTMGEPVDSILLNTNSLNEIA